MSPTSLFNLKNHISKTICRRTLILFSTCSPGSSLQYDTKCLHFKPFSVNSRTKTTHELRGNSKYVKIFSNWLCWKQDTTFYIVLKKSEKMFFILLLQLFYFDSPSFEKCKSKLLGPRQTHCGIKSYKYMPFVCYTMYFQTDFWRV